jgi:hypothetical protein
MRICGRPRAGHQPPWRSTPTPTATRLHVRFADEAYHIGPPPARDSYLRRRQAARRGQALRRGGDSSRLRLFGRAGGVCPGMCADAGWCLLARRRARSDHGGQTNGPGNGDGRRCAHCARHRARPDGRGADRRAKTVGFPVLVKAAAGGGGKGMRPVHKAADLLDDALPAARREAKAAFGDDTVYIEKMITEARHIEIQLLADSHGNVIHLGERECSLAAPPPKSDRGSAFVCCG